MRGERLAVVVLLLGLATAGAVEPPQLELNVPQRTLLVGDRLDLEVAARGGAELMWGELTVRIPPAGDWELVAGPEAVPGSSPPVWKLSLAPMQVGELELPQISASVRPADGEAYEVTPEDTPTLRVGSVLPADEEQAKPIPLRDPLGVSGFPWEWATPIFVALLPLLILAAWWWRRRGGAGASPDGEPLLPPLEDLLARLEELEARVGRQPAPAVCDGLATGARRYLERRSGEPALEMTSHELRLLARRARWPERVQQSLQRVMAVADGVRFGRQNQTDQALLAAISEARELGRRFESFLAPSASEQNGVERAEKAS